MGEWGLEASLRISPIDNSINNSLYLPEIILIVLELEGYLRIEKEVILQGFGEIGGLC